MSVPTIKHSGLSCLNLMAPSPTAAAVTKHDTNTIPLTRSVYVGGAGSLKVTMADGADVTFAAVPAGTTIPIRVVRVFSTGTTATSIVALY